MIEQMKLTFYELYKLCTKGYIIVVITVLTAVYAAYTVCSAVMCTPAAADYANVIAAQSRAVERAENNLAGSIDALTEYERNYQLEIVDIYSDIRENLAEADNKILGWDVILHNGLRGVFSCAIIILLVAELNLVEKNIGSESLLSTLKLGKKPVRRAKLNMVVLVSAAAAILPLLVDIAVFALLGKLSPPTLPVQYVDGFTLCPVKCTVSGCLALQLCYSTIGAVLFGLAAAVTASITRKYIVAYLLCGGILGGLFAFHLTDLFGARPIWSVLDLLSTTNGYPLLERYRAVNLINYPLWLGIFLPSVYLILCTVAAITYLLNPCRLNINSQRKISGTALGISRSGLHKIHSGLRNIDSSPRENQPDPCNIDTAPRNIHPGFMFRPHLSLIRYELYKQLRDFRRLGILLLIAALKVLLANQAYAPLELYDDDLYKIYALEVEGPLNDEAYEFVAVEKEYINETLTEQRSVDAQLASGKITLEEYSVFSEKYNYALTHQEPLDRLERQIYYLESRAALGEDIDILYTTGWELFLQDGMDFSLLLAVLLIGGASFADEYSAHLSNGSFAAILGSTKRGRRVTVLCKLAASVILTTIVTLAFSAIDLIVITQNYYLPLASANTHSIQKLLKLPAISLAGNTILMMLVKLLAAIILVMTVTALSRLTRRGYAAIAIASVITLIPRMCVELGFVQMKAVDFADFMGYTPMLTQSKSGFMLYVAVLIIITGVEVAASCKEK